mgnify:CR=1 FL=1
MKKSFYIIFCIAIMHFGNGQEINDLRNQKIDGYRGIWFELNQKYAYGDKYSGALGTYTAKHIPLAVYSPEVNKTFFVYGGTTQEDERHLLCMVGTYDHTTGLVSKPTVAYDKQKVDDPHDNPTILIDDEGYIWVFVSGRGTSRKGVKLKSNKPFSIDSFDILETSEFTYPQIWNTDKGFFHFFTKYKFLGVRELFFESFLNKKNWTSSKKLASIPSGEDRLGGHYQISGMYKKGKILGTFFNRHTNGNVDTRSDLYYLQTTNYGSSWSTVYGRKIAPPVNMVKSRSRVIDYRTQQKNVYLKDMAFDNNGNPVCLYITSEGHEPGPVSAPYEWRVTFWTGEKWVTNIVTTSDHNYDMGSIYIMENDIWKIVGPTEDGPQKYGVGGEIAIWVSDDCGRTWSKEKTITENSELNHSYVRRPLQPKAPFSFFWANGNPKVISKSELFFGDFEGNVYRLPYNMDQEWEKPLKVH